MYPSPGTRSVFLLYSPASSRLQIHNQSLEISLNWDEYLRAQRAELAVNHEGSNTERYYNNKKLLKCMQVCAEDFFQMLMRSLCEPVHNLKQVSAKYGSVNL